MFELLQTLLGNITGAPVPAKVAAQKLVASSQKEETVEALWRTCFKLGVQLEGLQVRKTGLEHYQDELIKSRQWLDYCYRYMYVLAVGGNPRSQESLDEIIQKFEGEHTRYQPEKLQSYSPKENRMRPSPTLALDLTEEEYKAGFATYKASGKLITMLSLEQYSDLLFNFTETISAQNQVITKLQKEYDALWKSVGVKEREGYELRNAIARALPMRPAMQPDLVSITHAMPLLVDTSIFAAPAA